MEIVANISKIVVFGIISYTSYLAYLSVTTSYLNTVYSCLTSITNC